MKKIIRFFESFVGDSQLRRALWDMRKDLLTAAGLSALMNALMLSPSIYMLQIFDRVMVSQNTLTLGTITGLIAFLFMIISVSDWLRTRQLVQIGLRFETLVSSKVFHAANRAKIARGEHRADDAISDLAGLRQFLTGPGLFSLFDLPWAPIYMVVVVLLHPAFGLLASIGIFLLLFLSRIQQRYSKEPTAAAQVSAIRVNRFIHGKLRNAEAIEAMGMQESLRTRWLRMHKEYSFLNGKSQAVSNRVDTVTKFVRYSLQSLSLGLGALLVIFSDLSMGSMVVGNILISKTLQPIEALISSWRTLVGARASFIRLEKLLEDYPDHDYGVFLDGPIKQVSLKALSAWAPGNKKQILQSLSVDFCAGQVTAIVGPSGSGKSTLLRILTGVWPSVRGAITINGIPRNELEEVRIGSLIGYVPQDVELFEGTIAQNIARLGEINSEEVIRAARLAQLHEYILRFPNGYDTQIGEGGTKLSGGQRQRIALARALYGNPDLIVLDEPNANLDDVGDRALASAVSDLKAAGKIVIFVSHRQQLLQSADQVIVMNSGSVAFSGSFSEFVSKRNEAISSMRNKNV